MNKLLLTNTKTATLNIESNTYYIVIPTEKAPRQIGIRYIEEGLAWDKDKFFHAIAEALQNCIPVIMAVYKNRIITWECNFNNIKFFTCENGEKKLIYTI